MSAADRSSDEKPRQVHKEKSSSSFSPKSDWSMISQGAEARIWKIPNYQGTLSALAKERFAKAYRHPVLDERLTKQRCRAESRVLEKLEATGVDVPAVYRVEPPVLYLEFIEGITVRQRIDELLQEQLSAPAENRKNGHGSPVRELPEALLKVAQSMGTAVGSLHKHRIVHGDLTTSNMMIRSSSTNTDKPPTTLIDFGLAKTTESAEERAVDLYVLERAIQSTHGDLPQPLFGQALMASYEQITANPKATLTRLEQVRQRGRKRECFG